VARPPVQEVKANAAALVKAQAAEAKARAAFDVAKRALDAAVHARSNLARAHAVCVDCALLELLGEDDCTTVDAQCCDLCRQAFCRACFAKFELCDRCDGHDRCEECCRERHGSDGDASCSDDDPEDIAARRGDY
jgi:hypothetical protein